MIKKVIYASMAFAPVLALAQNLSGLETLVGSIGRIISRVIPVMFALAIVYFFWGVVQFLRNSGDPKAQEAGKTHMIYGIIGIAVMVSIYGLVAWLQSTLGISSGGGVTLPCVPGYPCN